MKKKIISSVAATLATTMLVSAVGPSLASAKEATNSFTQKTLPSLPSIVEQYENYDPDMFDLESPSFRQDIMLSKSIIHQEIRNNQKGVTTQGVLGAGLKGIKAFGSIVKNGGHMLSWILKPFSKKYADAVKRNSAKIGKALAKPEKATRSHVKKLLTDHGVPKDDAEMITKIIFWLL
ncbi:hypothetical protein GCM10010978_20190 [Compostibacillus humi]|mgnify:CR=1 FL=1|uniref:Uncharacterized protein n=1 Tax=Compostibacillus humi TaxID=1245525 RepID=A0A8J2TMD6_9BACI|nr:hypothetical protein [Compostibacillus humi]GFZ78760.1 hypothetical protein GCM10010978_20190 [Compostibacillus humi]